MKVFLDINVLVSAYTARGICADLLRYILTEHELLTGEVNLVELRHVLRNRFRASPELIASVEAELRDETIVPKPAKPSPLSIRDPDDRWCLRRRSMAMPICWSRETETSWRSHVRLRSLSSIRAAAGIVSASSGAVPRGGAGNGSFPRTTDGSIPRPRSKGPSHGRIIGAESRQRRRVEGRAPRVGAHATEIANPGVMRIRLIIVRP